MDRVFSGLSTNRSLKHLCLQFVDFNFTTASFALLYPFVLENDNLVNLDLYGCPFSGIEDIQGLSDALGRRRIPASITSFTLAECQITDAFIPAIVGVLYKCPRLKRVDLRANYIEDGGCNGLASLLQNNDIKLNHLNLCHNLIGDEGAQILADALTNNNSLKRLHLNYNRPISQRGWSAFERVLCNCSSIDTIHQSNHSLVRIWWTASDQYNMGLSDNLQSFLQMNRGGNEQKKIGKKLIHYHLRGNFNLSQFLEMDLKLLPFVLHLIGHGIDENPPEVQNIRLSEFYHIMCNIPGICGFPSRERKLCLSVQEKNALLEQERNELKASNASLRQSLEKERVEKCALRSDIANMKQQIEQLKSENELLKSNKRQKYHGS